MENKIRKYLVRRTGGRELIIPAKNGTEAKRKACKHWGYKPNDHWLGITVCSAKLIPAGKVG